MADAETVKQARLLSVLVSLDINPVVYNIVLTISLGVNPGFAGGAYGYVAMGKRPLCNLQP
jgi:hypothetical protein